MNLHFSLLPAWRGAAPVQHAILHGDDVTGASTFQIEAGLDTGPVFGVVTEAIRPDRHRRRPARPARGVRRRAAGRRRWTASRTARWSPRPQPADGVSIAGKITVADARVDWDAPARHVDRLVRACTPAPGAWTTFRGERLKLGPVRVRGANDAGARASCAVERGRASRSARPPPRSNSGRAAARQAARCRRPTGRAGLGSSAGRASRLTATPCDPAWSPTSCCARSTPTAPTRTSRCRADRRARADTGATPRSPPSSATAPCAPPAPSTRSSPRASTGRSPRSTRRCATCCGSARTRRCAPGSRRTPPSRRPSIWPARPATARAAGSSTPSCAGSRARTGTGGSTQLRPGRGAAAPRSPCAPPTRSGSSTPSPTRSAATSPRPTAALAADDERPQTHLVAWPGRVDRDELLAESGGEAGPVVAVRGAPGRRRPGRARAVREHRAGVQDEGSQLCALALAAAPLDGRDERWLDLCAGPGGKAALLAALAAERGARLTANELRPHRAELVRARHRAVAGRRRGRRRPRAAPADGGYDRVLLDAPCTGLGALRRRPEARWRRDPGDVADAGRACSASCSPPRCGSSVPGGVVGLRDLLAAPRPRPREVVAGHDLLDARPLLPGRARPRRRADRPAVAAPARHRRDVLRARCAAAVPSVDRVARTVDSQS